MDFSALFRSSRGQPVTWEGKTLVLADQVAASLGERFTVTIESTASSHLQGVGVSEGVSVFGERVKRAVVFEHFSLPPELRANERSRLPFSFEVECRSRKGHLSFYNMALLNSRQEWWVHGCAMIVEVLENGRRYFCNDFEPDSDFDDIVFSVQRSQVAAQPLVAADAPKAARR